MSQVQIPMPTSPGAARRRIMELEQQLKEQRRSLTLLKRPISTLRLFLGAVADCVVQGCLYASRHPVVVYCLAPAMLLWIVLECFPGFYTDAINRVEFSVQFVVWWLGLGVLSSIGLGSGIHSGVLFLFPHIMKVVLASQECKSTNFDSASEIWFRNPSSLFRCAQDPTSDAMPSFLALYGKVFWPSFLWGTGTAIGEIPPYWVSKMARLAEEDAGIPEELEASGQRSVFNYFKQWMMSFIEKHGFMGVLFLASWPNLAFDLCGIFCGHFLMPFWTFFGATFIGKVLIRTTYTTMFLVAMFSEQYMEKLIKMLQAVAPDSLHIDHVIREGLEHARKNLHTSQEEHLKEGAEAESEGGMFAWLAFAWTALTTIIMVVFLLSSIQQFAQLRATHLDRQKIERMKFEAGVQSPVSTRKTFKGSQLSQGKQYRPESLPLARSPQSGSKKEN